jgi:BirA family biotin operon repressor/biotin-[acetyl-CoA-carboxylase] ligase
VSDPLTPDVVVPLLRGRLGRPYRFVERTASTQRLLGHDDPEGATVAADEQTEGRGRLGRTWVAPARSSLLFSVLLRPAVPTPRLPELSPLAARAVAAAVGGEVKEPNDVLIGGRKVCGILPEASEGRVVLGIGVNVNQTEDELLETATSLRVLRGEPVQRAPLLASILLALEREYDLWQA